MTDVLLIALAYLFGSIPTAVLVSRIMGLPDPRTVGSGNPGATNVLRSGNPPAAALTLAGDILKGVLPVLAARALDGGPWTLAGVALAAFVGHLYPLFLGFRGGKGVATAIGVYLALAPVLAGLLIGTWLVMALATRYSSLSALTAAALGPVYAWWLDAGNALVALSVVIAALLFWRHRANIARLKSGTESRIGSGSG
jgi:glycerol-3-phosphate acyltransferase PlsY